MITKDDVLHIANISMLKFSDEEIDEFAKKFGQVLEFVETIKEVNTDGVEPTYQVNDDWNMKTHDESCTLSRDEVLMNTKEQEYGYFKILKIVE